ncbi:hypothetical protein ACLB1G_13800 [Oxalobacteraceae bacterium A2-2]
MKFSTLLSNTIRGISMTFGCLIVVASIPLALLGGAAPQDTVPTFSPLLTTPLAAFILASGFFYVAIFGRRLATSRWQYWFGGLLLAIPLGVGISLLRTPEEQRLHFPGLFFFVPACLLFLCSIWPLQLTVLDSKKDKSRKSAT